jgi:hypothetical protein
MKRYHLGFAAAVLIATAVACDGGNMVTPEERRIQLRASEATGDSIDGRNGGMAGSGGFTGGDNGGMAGGGVMVAPDDENGGMAGSGGRAP